MDLALREQPVETAVDAAAATAFAVATAYATAALFVLAAAPAALLTFAGVFIVLRLTPGTAETYSMPAFSLADLPDGGVECEELLLTEEMVPDQLGAGQSSELVLDDALARPESGSRVVQLFGPAQIANAGELRANIGGHLHIQERSSNASDATQALSDALAQLRRSLH